MKIFFDYLQIQKLMSQTAWAKNPDQKMVHFSSLKVFLLLYGLEINKNSDCFDRTIFH